MNYKIINRDLNTGIPYGIIKASAIDPELWDSLCYVHGKDLSYEGAQNEELDRQQKEHEEAVSSGEAKGDFEPNLNDFDPQIDEPIHEGEHEGVKYRTTWLGGAPLLWVFKSPFVTKCAQCSPCVPGAGDLDSVGDYEAYGVPVTWLTEDFINEFVHDAGCGIFLNQGKYLHSPDQSLQQISKSSFDTVEQANEDCYKMRLQRPVE